MGSCFFYKQWKIFWSIYLWKVVQKHLTLSLPPRLVSDFMSLEISKLAAAIFDSFQLFMKLYVDVIEVCEKQFIIMPWVRQKCFVLNIFCKTTWNMKFLSICSNGGGEKVILILGGRLTRIKCKQILKNVCFQKFCRVRFHKL